MRTLEYYRQANRKSYAKHRKERLSKQKAYRQTDAGKKVQARKDKKQQLKHPLHWYARNAVWRAVKNDKLEKNSFCAVANCKEEEHIEAHHYLGYEKEHWLDVIWLCRNHHRQAEKSSNIYENPELLK